MGYCQKHFNMNLGRCFKDMQVLTPIHAATCWCCWGQLLPGSTNRQKGQACLARVKESYPRFQHCPSFAIKYLFWNEEGGGEGGGGKGGQIRCLSSRFLAACN